MQINNLKRKTKNRKTELVGRGGKRGKTCGKGQKGQNSRAGRKKRPEMRERIKKIPKLRGYAFKGIHKDYVWPVNLNQLESNFKAGSKINPAVIASLGLAEVYKGKNPVVKILATGELTKKLEISGCLVSASAKEKIEKVGGSVK
ncbi:MAG: uL15m family ribosomal protein [bacterium]